MTSKKIIAICQSGGEFVTNKDDGSLSYTGGEAYAVDLDQETCLDDFKKEVAEAFQYSTDGMSMKYFLPGNKKTLISVSKDKDIKRMVNFLKDSDQVEVFVIGEEAPAGNLSNMPASRSSRTTVSEAVIPHTDQMDLCHPCNDKPIQCIPLDVYPCSSDEKNGVVAMQWENMITGVNQRFNSLGEFREALRKYSIAHGFNYKYKKNDSHRVTVICKSEGCPWRIHASRLSTTQLICIKKMNSKHTCDGAVVTARYRATRGWVGSIIKEKLKTSPNYKPKDIAEDIKREFGIQLNYSQAYRAKEFARKQLQGSYEEAYNHLPSLCEKIVETNPRSVAKVITKDDSSFHRLFVSFHASILGFQQGCRPILFLDTILLYSKYQGTLLSAIGADGDDGVFPVAFAVVDEESDDNWRWFLSELKPTISSSRQITFVADFQKGLRESLPDIFGKECYHGYCLRYLAEKLMKDLKAQFSHEARRLMVQDLYAAACAPSPEAFECCAENIRAISPEAYNWVLHSEPDHWANAFFGGARYNHMTSNFGQLFHDWIAEVDELPITQMVDILRGKLMELIYMRRVDSSQWVTRLTPSMEDRLQSEASKARSFKVLFLQGSTYEVRGESVSMVDIDNWDCSCKSWQLSGLPCCHAIAVIECLGRSPYDYCSRYFTTECYRLAYAESINPVPNVEKPANGEVQETIITTPPIKRPPGRPKVKQTDLMDVIKRQLQCSKCKGLGHNKRRCNQIEKIDAGDGNMLIEGFAADEPELEPEGSS